MALKMAVVVDYQNVHLTAAGLYLPGRPPEEALIDPYRFASQFARARNAKNDDAPRDLGAKVSVRDDFDGIAFEGLSHLGWSERFRSARPACGGFKVVPDGQNRPATPWTVASRAPEATSPRVTDRSRTQIGLGLLLPRLKSSP